MSLSNRIDNIIPKHTGQDINLMKNLHTLFSTTKRLEKIY